MCGLRGNRTDVDEVVVRRRLIESYYAERLKAIKRAACGRRLNGDLEQTAAGKIETFRR